MFQMTAKCDAVNDENINEYLCMDKKLKSNGRCMIE